MPYSKKARPSAKREKAWLCETYGSEFCQTFNEWCEKIVEHAPENPGALLLIPLEEILEEKTNPWSYVWRQLKDRTALDRLRSLISFIKNRKPPFQLFAVQARFLTQGMYWINVIAIVELDHVDKEVIFSYFHWYGDE